MQQKVFQYSLYLIEGNTLRTYILFWDTFCTSQILFFRKICDLKNLYLIKIVLLEDLCPKIHFFGFFFVNFTYAFKFIIITLSQNGSVPSGHDLCPFSCPGFWNQVFCPVDRFSKSSYFDPTCHGEFPNAKNFPGKFCPGSGFALNGSFLNVMRNFCELSVV